MIGGLEGLLTLSNSRVTEVYVKPYPYCTHRTNTGHDAVILVSDWDHNGAFPYLKDESRSWKDYLEKHKLVLGYPVDSVYSVDSAKANDLADAIKDPRISSIILFGHSGVGRWVASDRRVSHNNVAEWAKEAGHCKDGFGFKAGCNVIWGKEKMREYGLPDNADEYQLLAPTYGHLMHPGGLYIMKGMPFVERGYLSGSTLSPHTAHPELLKLVPVQWSEVLVRQNSSLFDRLIRHVFI